MALDDLLRNNATWARAQVERDPDVFARLAAQQSPRFLWIGCADSRVPANQILGLDPGEVFVHRNVANLVNHGDLNCLAVLQYAIEVLRVEHVIVTGHYGCGGIRAALEPTQLGLIDHWLRAVRDLHGSHYDALQALDPVARADRLCELNVMAQVENVCHSGFVQNAWSSGRRLHVHGLIYGLHDGRLRDLGVSRDDAGDIPPAHRLA